MSSRFPMPGAWDISWDNPSHPATQNDEDPNSVCTTPPGQPSPSQDMTTTKEDGNYTNPDLQRGSELQIWKSPSGVSDRPISLEDVAETSEHRDNTPPIVIAVFGKTGTGKTSFIKAVAGKDLKVGHSLTSCTEDVLAVPCRVDGKNVMLVDTPGFSDTNLSDTEILRRIATWMKDNYDDGFLLSGIIYLHRIIDVRMEGPSLKNLRMMRALCGENSLKNVVLATTMWERVPEEEGARREAELKDLFWKDMIAYGSAVKRILTESGDDARTLVKSMLTNRPTSTRLQDELHSGKTLVQTEAGIEIREEIAKLERKLKKEHEMDMADLKQAQNQRNEELQSRIRAEMEENRQRIVRLETEKRELERSTISSKLPRARRKGIFGMGRYPCLFCDEMETYKVGRWTCKLCKNQQINVIS